MLLGAASLSAHIILSVVGILTMLGSMAFSAAAFRSWFRLYWLISPAGVVTFFGLALSDAPEVNAEKPTRFIGLYQGIAFSAYFRWMRACDGAVAWAGELRR